MHGCLQAHPHVKLRRTNFKMAQRVATVSKAIKDISGMGSRMESTGALRETDLDARHIFVGVHAGGLLTHLFCMFTYWG